MTRRGRCALRRKLDPDKAGSDVEQTGWNSYTGSMKSVVSEKGQVTIPKAVRDRLGLTPGTVLSFEALGGKLVGQKALAEDVFKKWRGKGKLPGTSSVDIYLARIRDADGR